MRLLLGMLCAIIGAALGVASGGVMGYLITRIVVGHDLVKSGGWTLIGCASLFVTQVVVGAWVGAKLGRRLVVDSAVGESQV